MVTDREEEGRARRRWRLLREAIRDAGKAAAVADDNDSTTTPTTTAYAVPGLAGGAMRSQAEIATDLNSTSLCVNPEPWAPASDQHVLMLPAAAPRPSSSRASSALEHLISHRLTGVRIWPAEEALLEWCLHQRPPGDFGGKRVLEMGAGMAGLAGLGLACYAHPPPAEVVLTDGHPDCVAALEACVTLNRERLRCPVRVERLVWGKHDAQDLQGIDVVLGADLLFFEDFHAALLDLLSSVLRQGKGVACFLQPSRGGALERFVSRARAAGGQEVRWEVVEEEVGPVEGVVLGQQQQQKEEDRLRLLRLRLVGR